MIQALCEVLTRHEGALVEIQAHPDRGPGNTGGCDAIILRGGVQWAVEHTTVHTQIKKPLLIKQLDVARPIIASVVVRAYPNSIVRVGIPVTETVALKAIPEIAERAAHLSVAALRSARVRERARFGVPGLPADGFAERFIEPVSRPLCSVHPAVWGRDEDEFTADDYCRALAEKRRQAEHCGMPVILLLDTGELINLLAAFGPYEMAVARESVAPYKEIYIGTRQYDPPWIIPLKMGDRSPVGQPELGQFIGYRFDAARDPWKATESPVGPSGPAGAAG